MKLLLLTIPFAFIAGCASTPPSKSISMEPFELHSFEQQFGYTQANKVGNRIYVSGTVSMDKDGNVAGKDNMRLQIFHSYEAVRKSLAHYGADFSHVVKETIHTTDMDAFLAATDERAKFYTDTRFPVSSWIGVQRLVSPEFLIEIEVEAVIPPKP